MFQCVANYLEDHKTSISPFDFACAFKEGSKVTPELLIKNGFVKGDFDGIKILGNGELKVKLTVEANAFSKSAKAAIEKVGGVAKEI